MARYLGLNGACAALVYLYAWAHSYSALGIALMLSPQLLNVLVLHKYYAPTATRGTAVRNGVHAGYALMFLRVARWLAWGCIWTCAIWVARPLEEEAPTRLTGLVLAGLVGTQAWSSFPWDALLGRPQRTWLAWLVVATSAGLILAGKWLQEAGLSSMSPGTVASLLLFQGAFGAICLQLSAGEQL